MNEKAIPALRAIFGERLKTSLEDRICYSFDATGKEYLPDTVVFPLSAEEIRRTVLLANEHRFPVVPRGAGSGRVRPVPRADGPDSLDRHGEPRRRRRAGRGDRDVEGGSEEKGPLLPSRPRVAEVLHDRREPRRVRLRGGDHRPAGPRRGRVGPPDRGRRAGGFCGQGSG